MQYEDGWEYASPHLRLVVRHYYGDRGAVLLDCLELGVRDLVLDTVDMDTAKGKALALVRRRLVDMLADVL